MRSRPFFWHIRPFLACLFAAHLAVFVVFLAACSGAPTNRPVDQTGPTPAIPPTVTPTEPAPPTATPVTGKHLTICLASEPEDLYWYGRSHPAKTAVLHALYENDYTTLDYSYQPQGLKKLPSLTDGDAAFQSVQVAAGDRVINANGDIIRLEVGDRIITTGGEPAVFDGANPLFMDQMVVDFSLHQRTWADGKPVTAADSVYSFNLAADPETTGDKRQIDLTAGYETTGPLSTRWTGIPGHRDRTFFTNFWHPLPEHAWEEYSTAELTSADVVNQNPVGDGPFQIATWKPGEYIQMEPNPFYYQTGAGFPPLDSLTFRFIPDVNQRITQLLAGKCDILTDDGFDGSEIPFFWEAENNALLRAVIWPGDTMHQISLGVNSWQQYGDGFERPDWFENPSVRQALNLCIDREEIATTLLFGRIPLTASFISSDHPNYPPDFIPWARNLETAEELFANAGLRDFNLDGILQDAASNTQFQVMLKFPAENTLARQTAQILQKNWRECGVDVVLQPLTADIWQLSGELHPLNGRQFDLGYAQIPIGNRPACSQFSSNQITGPPGNLNPQTGIPFGGWYAANHTGWFNSTYDQACAIAMNPWTETAVSDEAYATTQTIFADQLPALPLFAQPRVAATSQNVLGFNPNPTQDSSLWNIFALDLASK